MLCANSMALQCMSGLYFLYRLVWCFPSKITDSTSSTSFSHLYFSVPHVVSLGFGPLHAVTIVFYFAQLLIPDLVFHNRCEIVYFFRFSSCSSLSLRPCDLQRASNYNNRYNIVRDMLLPIHLLFQNFSVFVHFIISYPVSFRNTQYGT